MALKVVEMFSGLVSVGKISIVLVGFEWRIVCLTPSRFSCERASSATARLPWLGEERIRPIPVPCNVKIRAIQFQSRRAHAPY